MPDTANTHCTPCEVRLEESKPACWHDVKRVFGVGDQWKQFFCGVKTKFVRLKRLSFNFNTYERMKQIFRKLKFLWKCEFRDVVHVDHGLSSIIWTVRLWTIIHHRVRYCSITAQAFMFGFFIVFLSSFRGSNFRVSFLLVSSDTVLMGFDQLCPTLTSSPTV